MKVATRAQAIAAAEAMSAARLAGEPHMPNTARTATAPKLAVAAEIHAWLDAAALPPWGSDMARNTASATQVTIGLVLGRDVEGVGEGREECVDDRHRASKCHLPPGQGVVLLVTLSPDGRVDHGGT